MLKYSQTYIISILNKLFNLIFSHGKYPYSWGISYITPLHKSGSKHEPTNYRGIAIGDNIGKLFNRILNNRLSKFLKSNDLICQEQIGFVEGCRTSDHMYVVNTLIQKYVKNSNKPLYACFVDFQKAFDSVSHVHLLYKLKMIGVGSKFYEIIKNMYNQSYSCVKVNNERSKFFSCGLGVRQGDNLSPNLFNIFVNDLPKYFDQTCDPVQLMSKSINTLMYADDVILLSTSEKGLQNCVNKLEKFSKDWKMTVNLKKTKVLVFNKAGRKKDLKIKFDNNLIENVKQYKYLGIIFTSSGTFSSAKHELLNKGTKALFKLKIY